MVKICDAKGIPIVCLKDDSRIGYIISPVYDDYNCVCGFMANTSGFSFHKKYVPLETILRIDTKNCVIYSENSVRRFTKALHLRTQGSLENMLGRSVINRQGEGLGIVRDLVFDLETGIIEGFELSRGYMEDVVQGRKTVLLRDGVEFGEEFIVIGKGDGSK